MRSACSSPRLFLLSLLVALLPLALAQQSTGLETILPSCALSCLSTALSHSACAPTNQTCICLDGRLQDETTVCVVGTCTIKEALYTKNITSIGCRAPLRDRRKALEDLTIILGSLSGFFVALRILSRLFIVKGDLGLDDWFIIATLLVGIPNTVIIVHGMIANGMGLDVWTLESKMINSFGRFFYTAELIYFALVTVLKMSLLFFYLRIFPTRTVRRLLWGTVAFNAVFGVVFVFVAAFQCWPVEFFWTRWDLEHEGRCLDINAIAWANAAISIALDIWMLALPLWQLRTLNLHWKKKFGVALMFGVGTFVTIMSILRLQSLVTFANSLNPTWDNYDVTNWSTIEINVGIICACMPSLRLLLVRLFPRLGGSTGRHYAASGGSKGTPGRYYAGGTGGGLGLSSSAAAAGAVAGAKGGGASQNRSRNGAAVALGGDAVAKRASLPLRGGKSGGGGVVGVGGAGAAGGISYQRSYMVSYGDAEQDEESLVQMHDLDLSGDRPGVGGGGGMGKPMSKGSTTSTSRSRSVERGLSPVDRNVI